MSSTSTIDSVHLIRTDARTQVLLDVYETYQLVQKHLQGKESTIQTFATLLTDTYKMYIGNKVSTYIYICVCVQGGALEVLRAIIFESAHYSKKC